MKKLLGLLVLICLKTQAQVDIKPQRYTFISAGFDVANAIVGSKPTDSKPSLDFQVKIGAVDENWNTEVYLQYENFATIDFQQYGAGVNAILFPLYKVDISLGLETGYIIREKNSSYFYYGFNTEVRYDLSKKISMGLQGNYRKRNDIQFLYNTGKDEWVFSGWFNLRYRLN